MRAVSQTILYLTISTINGTLVHVAKQSYPICGRSSMVELQPSKLTVRVRFPSPAPFISDSHHLMVGVVKWLRHRIVAPACVGSNPIIHPITLLGYSQVGKATDFDSVMRRFESCYPSQTEAGSPATLRKWLSGRASPCQGEGRGFNSRLPLHFILAALAQLDRVADFESVGWGFKSCMPRQLYRRIRHEFIL
jgi:hypothetical protein